MFEIWLYTAATWGDDQAEKYLRKLESRFLDLADEPSKGRLRDDLGLQCHSYLESWHIIFYRPYEHGILIARVLHERMDINQRLVDDTGLN